MVQMTTCDLHNETIARLERELAQAREERDAAVRKMVVRDAELATLREWVQELPYSRQLADAKEEVRFLRRYGNKDCTAQADEALAMDGYVRAEVSGLPAWSEGGAGGEGGVRKRWLVRYTCGGAHPSGSGSLVVEAENVHEAVRNARLRAPRTLIAITSVEEWRGA
jgi:hypothetical protein